jgi:hypothetical protein
VHPQRDFAPADAKAQRPPLRELRERNLLVLGKLLHAARRAARLEVGRRGDAPNLHLAPCDVQAEPAVVRASMLDAGLSPDAADQMAEMAHWLSSRAHAVLPGPVEVTPSTLEDFAPCTRAAWQAALRDTSASVQT